MAPSHPSTPRLAGMLIFLPHLQKIFLSPACSNVKRILLLSVAALPLLQQPRIWAVKVKPSLVRASPFLQHQVIHRSYSCRQKAGGEPSVISPVSPSPMACVVPPGLPLGQAMCAGAEGQRRDRR